MPLLTLAADGADRTMFGGAYVVDDFSLVLKGLFVLAGYLTVLLSTHYISEGDYWEGEYYTLLIASVLGMVVMASARDLITIFVALELLSIPAYLLAGWRKRTLTGNEAGMKYYLMGVFASGVMLYGMSLIYGGTGTTLLADIGAQMGDGAFGETSAAALGIVFVARRLRLQGLGRPVPQLGPGHLRGRADPDHRVPLGRVEGRRLRRPDDADLRRLLRHATTSTGR